MTGVLTRSPRTAKHLVGVLALVVVVLLALSANASADLSFCPPGSGAGQCLEPEGVAVDTETGRLYVADRGNNRVDVFESDGDFLMAFGWGVADGTTNALQTCTATCFKGIYGSGSGQLGDPTRVAVDNTGGPSQGDIYVADDFFRVQKFSPTGALIVSFGSKGKGKCQLNGIITENSIAVGPGGIVYVADSVTVAEGDFDSSEGYIDRIQKFEPSGACLEELELFKAPRPLDDLAVASSGDIYVTIDGGGFGIRKFNSMGVEYGIPYPLELVDVSSIEVDGEGNLFASETESLGESQGLLRVIAEYDPTGNAFVRFGYDTIQFRLLDIAFFHGAAGDVFAAEREVGLRYFSLPQPAPIVAPSTVQAAPLGNTKATLNAQVNPEGKATEYHFDYVDQEGFEASGFASAQSTPTTALGAEDFKLHSAKVDIGCPNPPVGNCLDPDTTYHFRVIASNADGSDEAEAEFKTKPALEISATYATEVGTDTATLNAEVNPLGIPANGYFQYVDDAKYKASGFAEAIDIPNVGEGEGALDFGKGEAPSKKSALLYPLTPGTTYHYRVIAEDPLIEPLAGPERTFTTFESLAAGEGGPCTNDVFRDGTATFLADCRAYEMVSPLDKNNGDVLPLDEIFSETPAQLNQSSLSGNRLTYSSAVTFGEAASAPYSAQYIAARDLEDGWMSHSIVPPRGAPLLVPGRQTDAEFKAFSSDLCSGWLRTVAEPALTANANPRFANLYRRQDEECGGPAFEALTVVPPSHEGGESALFPGNYYFSLELQGVSADGGEAIFAVLDSLTEETPPPSAECLKEIDGGNGCVLQLYQYSAADQSLHYVCILPSGQASKACSAGTPFSALGNNRDNNVNNAISADGSRVFWSSVSAKGPTGYGSGKIYLRENPTQPPSEVVGGECTETELACTIEVSKDAEALSGASASQYWTAAKDGSKAIFTSGEDLYEFTVEDKATHLIAHEVSGVMGASEDASRIYFTSKEDLGGGAVAGQPNLYFYEGGSFGFVATLAAADLANDGELSLVASRPQKRVARVSADGLHAAFMSFASPTGYDNKDAKNGKAAAEVYLYNAAANGGEGKLACVSCNPTGARPVGANVAVKAGTEYWAAAQLPTWQNTLYAARVLSDDGSRLYFSASDALSPRDTNGTQDVYQWEQVGRGNCNEGDPSFAPASGGCLSLVSSGKSDYPSEFVEASPSGDDVFFSTLSSLVSQDYGLVDIYDARVGGGFPPPPPAKPACEGEACQGVIVPPSNPTPSSAAFKGPGDPVAGKPPSCRKNRVRRKGRCVAKRQHHKGAHRAKRANNNGKASR